MNNFAHHMAQLEAQGFVVERGMLAGEARFAQPQQIGTRFESGRVQIDTYLLTEFFAANKAQPKLGNQEHFEGPEGDYTVTQILA